MPGLASISIDLDGLPHYAALHGLPPEVVSAEARALVHRVAVPRFTDLVEGVGGRGTLFVIGAEVDEGARPPLEDALHHEDHEGWRRLRAREPQPRARLCAVARAGRGDRAGPRASRRGARLAR